MIIRANGPGEARSVCSACDQEDMLRAIHVNQPKPVIDRRFGLEEITAAFEYYQTKSHFGKVGVEI